MPTPPDRERADASGGGRQRRPGRLGPARPGDRGRPRAPRAGRPARLHALRLPRRQGARSRGSHAAGFEPVDPRPGDAGLSPHRLRALEHIRALDAEATLPRPGGPPRWSATWSRDLAGQPDGGSITMKPARSLIVNADDYGLTAGVSRGILDSHRRGIVTSTTLLVNRAGGPRADRRAQGLGAGRGPAHEPHAGAAGRRPQAGGLAPGRGGTFVRDARRGRRSAPDPTRRASSSGCRSTSSGGSWGASRRISTPITTSAGTSPSWSWCWTSPAPSRCRCGRQDAEVRAAARKLALQDAGSLHGRVGPGRVLVVASACSRTCASCRAA